MEISPTRSIHLNDQSHRKHQIPNICVYVSYILIAIQLKINNSNVIFKHRTKNNISYIRTQSTILLYCCE